MKLYITLFLSTMMLHSSCRQNSQQATVPPAKMASDRSQHIRADSSKVEKNMILEQLVPIALLDSNNQNLFERYGIEFAGNCYNCDLAKLSIADGKVAFINVCDEADRFQLQNSTISKKDSTWYIQTESNTFILTQIHPIPIYQLEIIGPNFELANKRIATYFSTANQLPLFKAHDCADFDG